MNLKDTKITWRQRDAEERLVRETRDKERQHKWQWWRDTPSINKGRRCVCVWSWVMELLGDWMSRSFQFPLRVTDDPVTSLARQPISPPQIHKHTLSSKHTHKENIQKRGERTNLDVSVLEILWGPHTFMHTSHKQASPFAVRPVPLIQILAEAHNTIWRLSNTSPYK